MTTSGSIAGLSLFNSLNIAYETAYKNNPFKTTTIAHAISLLPKPNTSNSPPRVLDIGCGTGIPVSEMLANAGLEVHGVDIAPEMIKLAQSRVKGEFTVCDMLSYQPPVDPFAGVFLVFSHLQLKYKDVHTLCHRLAQALQPGGLFVIGQCPADTYVSDSSAYDRDGVWVEDYDAPFMGELLPTFMMTAEGQKRFLRGMGLEILWETVDTFCPEDERCVPEVQQYIIARRGEGMEIGMPFPLPLG